MDNFLLKEVLQGPEAEMARGMCMLKEYQLQAKGKAEWKPERFPCTDEQPVILQVIGEPETTKTAQTDGPY